MRTEELGYKNEQSDEWCGDGLFLLRALPEGHEIPTDPHYDPDRGSQPVHCVLLDGARVDPLAGTAQRPPRDLPGVLEQRRLPTDKRFGLFA